MGGEWKPIPAEGDDDSSSSEAESPYVGYVALDDEKQEADAEELVIEDDVEVVAPDPDAFLSASSMNKFLPRGTPASVLADEITDAPLPPIQKFDFDTIDYEEVHRVASKIKLKAFEKKE